jgi:hypothetical protein
MKRLLLGLGTALLLTTLGSVPAAQAWWWHHHSSPAPEGVGASNKDKRTKAHSEKHTRQSTAPLYTSPKTVGWWHKGPGPMGAGSGERGKTQTARRESHQKDKSAQRSSNHKLFPWQHRRESTPQPTTSTAGQ